MRSWTHFTKMPIFYHLIPIVNFTEVAQFILGGIQHPWSNDTTFKMCPAKGLAKLHLVLSANLYVPMISDLKYKELTSV
jgi:hypothetical protein